MNVVVPGQMRPGLDQTILLTIGGRLTGFACKAQFIILTRSS